MSGFLCFRIEGHIKTQALPQNRKTKTKTVKT